MSNTKIIALKRMYDFLCELRKHFAPVKHTHASSDIIDITEFDYESTQKGFCKAGAKVVYAKAERQYRGHTHGITNVEIGRLVRVEGEGQVNVYEGDIDFSQVNTSLEEISIYFQVSSKDTYMKYMYLNDKAINISEYNTEVSKAYFRHIELPLSLFDDDTKNIHIRLAVCGTNQNDRPIMVKMRVIVPIDSLYGFKKICSSGDYSFYYLHTSGIDKFDWQLNRVPSTEVKTKYHFWRLIIQGCRVHRDSYFAFQTIPFKINSLDNWNSIYKPYYIQLRKRHQSHRNFGWMNAEVESYLFYRSNGSKRIFISNRIGDTKDIRNSHRFFRIAYFVPGTVRHMKNHKHKGEYQKRQVSNTLIVRVYFDNNGNMLRKELDKIVPPFKICF